MKRIFFVVFCLLFTNSSFATAMKAAVQKIESKWELVEYNYPENQRKKEFDSLLKQTQILVEKFPNKSEPLILQACIILTRAKIESSFNALASVRKAKNLLEQAIKINPNANKGSAFVTLGVLYYKVPGWPIAFGDNEKAEMMLKKALAINPHGIDSNYYYAEYLLSQNKSEQAARYLAKAVIAPLHKPEIFSRNIKAKAKEVLKEISTLLASNGRANSL